MSSHLRVMEMLAIPGGFAVDVERALGQLLLGVQSLGESFKLVEFHGVVLTDRFLCTLPCEVHFVA